MKYIALYRKYRPKVFEEITEQETVVKILQEALKQRKIAHAYLFAGPKGTGKTSIARIFAKGLNCENGPTPHPCMKCEQCITITNGTNLDVIEIDAASNRGIDEIRDLKEKIQYAPVNARFKVYIIDEAHMLTMQAFNALLKTLEEPPENVVFILATTEPEKIPPTILSRCERFYFKPISLKGLMNKVKEVASKEGAKITDDAALLIARFASGSLRNALSLLDQSITMFENITEENVRALLGIPNDEILRDFLYSIIREKPEEALSIIKELEENGKDSKIFVNEFLNYLQDLLDGKVLGFDTGSLYISDKFIEELKEQSRYVGVNKIVEISFEFANLLNMMRFFPDPFFPVKLTTLKCMNLQTVPEKSSLYEEKENVEETKPVENVPVNKESSMIEDAEMIESPPAATGLDLVNSQWANILDEVKKVDKPLHAILVRVKPVEVQDDLITLVAEKEFYLHILKMDKSIKILNDAINRVLKKNFRIKYIEPKKENKNVNLKEEKIIKNDKTVNEVLTLFDGVITEIKKKDEEDKK